MGSDLTIQRIRVEWYDEKTGVVRLEVVPAVSHSKQAWAQIVAAVRDDLSWWRQDGGKTLDDGSPRST